jgi:hypothetical protein
MPSPVLQPFSAKHVGAIETACQPFIHRTLRSYSTTALIVGVHTHPSEYREQDQPEQGTHLALTQ